MSGPEEQFFAFLREGKFMIQRLRETGEHIFYPRYPVGKGEWDWVEAGGGTVYSYTTIRQKPERGGDYCVALVELDEGPRLMSRLRGVAPDDVRIGMRVEAEIVKPDWTDEWEQVLVFRAATDGAAVGGDHAA
ncbi:MAG: OB-fold domain-containing protein [Aquisalimonadaceae bacterium]